MNSKSKINEIENSIDILDVNDVFCPAIIKSTNQSNGTILVTYVGWDDEWDEELELNSSRISKDKKTVIAKAWVKLSSKFCYWPCKIYIRYPLKGSLKGEEYLRSEKRIFLYPYGPESHHLKPYKHGVWINVCNMVPFVEKTFTSKYSEGLASNHSSTFELAVKECQNDRYSNQHPFRFEMSLEISEKVNEQKLLLTEQRLEKERRLHDEKAEKARLKSDNRKPRVNRFSTKLSTDARIDVDDDYESISSKRIRDEEIPTQRSKLFTAYKMIKTNVSSLQPAAVESIQNVLKLISSTATSSNEKDTKSSIVDPAPLAKLFPFKMSDYCGVIQNFQDKSTGNGIVDRSPGGCIKRKKSSKNGLNRGRIRRRKQITPQHIEIKRSQSYLSIERIKNSFKSKK